MKLYVNGDSHAAGAEINNTYPFADNDPNIHNDPRPHPDNIVDSFGYLLAQKLDYQFVTDAQSGASNDRIYRTTNEFLEKNNSDVFVLIGWSTFDRKEILIGDRKYCFSPGFVTSDPEIQQEFKNYVLWLDNNRIIEQNRHWHEKIYKFHLELSNANIKHLFFNTYQVFNMMTAAHATVNEYNWNNRFIGAYTEKETYYHWLYNHGHRGVNGGYHYGAKGHAAWADRLYNWLTQHQLL